jgi:hypothetical protein
MHGLGVMTRIERVLRPAGGWTARDGRTEVGTALQTNGKHAGGGNVNSRYNHRMAEGEGVAHD